MQKSDTHAAFWYTEAAKGGNLQAQARLGTLYRLGKGVKQDYARALYWYRIASERNSSAARHGLGILYENGYGVEKDRDTALFWYTGACRGGNRDACTRRDALGSAP